MTADKQKGKETEGQTNRDNRSTDEESLRKTHIRQPQNNEKDREKIIERKRNNGKRVREVKRARQKTHS